ncbi:MAG: nucleotidyltransferase family protein [Allosphingosinicella sp.]
MDCRIKSGMTRRERRSDQRLPRRRAVAGEGGPAARAGAERTGDVREAMVKLPVDRDTLAAYCRSHGIKRLALFGSRLKGTASRDSDVDLLVEFESKAEPSLLDMAQMEIDLSEILGGVTVDLRTADELSRYFRDEIVETAELLHAA